MSKSVESTRRELFEAWANKEGWVDCSPCRDELMEAFNAALDAVENMGYRIVPVTPT